MSSYYSLRVSRRGNLKADSKLKVFMEDSMSDNLVVTSKIKKMIKEKSGFNTSASLIEALSGKVTKMCENAIEKAKTDGRKTVMDRDVDQ